MNKLFRISFKRFFVIGLALLFFLNFLNFSVVSGSEERPDLEIDYVDFSDEVIEGEEIEFAVRVRNIRNEYTGESSNISQGTIIWVSLRVDGVLVSTNYSDFGLDIDESRFINLSWIAELGQISQRQIVVEVDYTQDIFESNENNNERPGFIYVYEKDSDISIVDVELPDMFVVNEMSVIGVSIKNIGGETSKDVIVFLNSSVDDVVEKIIYEDTILRDEVVVFSFSWKPSMVGKQVLNIDIIYNNKTHDSYSASVFVGKLDWWNESWHYRYFISVTGEGNFSKVFNFTSLLEELGVYQQFFEKQTIRVVQYSSSGQIIGFVENYTFNESSDYDDVNNAKGSLLWKIPGGSTEKFYCVYFDVTSNDGIRNILDEDELMIVAGTVVVSSDGFPEAWSFEIVEPLDGGYAFVNDTVNMSVNNDAKADYVQAFVFLNDNSSNNKTFNLLDSGDGVSWFFNNIILNISGNWTFRIKCFDAAGYSTSEKQHTIFVGKPDLVLSNIKFETSWSPTSPKIYTNDTVYFTVSVFCSHATTESVNVTMAVYTDEAVEIFSKIANSTFEKDKYTNLSFNWLADLNGDFVVRFFVDSSNIIDEFNESNNEKELDLTVYSWPDLVVKDISWKKTTIMEYETVQFNIKVKNIGHGESEDYDLKLFIKPSSQKTIEYTDEVYTKKISIDSGDEKQFSLFWNSAVAGKWLIAAKVFVSDTKQDANTSNNGLFVTDELIVRPTEKNNPVIENVYVSPSIQQQGDAFDIIADVKDDTGLESVTIYIYGPDGLLIETDNMIRTTGDEFKYIFSNTLEIGIYDFVIAAVDISINQNNKTYADSFEVIQDQTPPVVSYFWVDPIVQLFGKSTTFVCIAKDNVDIDEVELFIIFPNGGVMQVSMDKNSEQYVYENIYAVCGKYSYYITLKDHAGNINLSETKYFYITPDLDDTDADEMPDWWEEKYGFNPFDSSDGQEDYDDDGVTNSEEYFAGTHPGKNIMLQNIAYRVRSNVLYIVFSILMFILLIILNIISRKRR